MIFYASQRANAAELAKHLLNTAENDHVTVHEVRGFATHDLTEALLEIAAISKGTRCKQYLFAISLNPPEEADVTIEGFEAAIEEIERRLKLVDQPRIIVFHEKKGRRHCHVVWSRLAVSRHTLGRMVAIPMNHFKRKLQEISYILFLKNGWKLPAGMRRKEDKSPFALSREEYRQAVRLSEDAQALKGLFKALWEQSDSKAAFASALEAHGFFLAQGDRRGVVAVDLNGKVYSLSRWIGVKAKGLAARLGEPEKLPITEQARRFIAERMTENLRRYQQSIKKQSAQKRQPLVRELRELVRQQRQERQALIDTQNTRRITETRLRLSRFAVGTRGLWERATGEHERKRRANAAEVQACLSRDRKELHTLIRSQLKERQALEQTLRFYREEETQENLRLRRELAACVSAGAEPPYIAQHAAAPKPPPLAEQLTQAETKIALLSGDIHQLQASLESHLLSDEAKARLRRIIEKTLETLHIKAIEKEKKAVKSKEAAKEVERKQAELYQAIRIYAELQHKREEEQRRIETNKTFHSIVMNMSYNLNGLPRWPVRVQVPPPERRLDEKVFTSTLRQQDNRTLSKPVLAAWSRPPLDPPAAAPTLRASVLEVKELLIRGGGLPPIDTATRKKAPIRIKMSDAKALGAFNAQRRPQ